MAWYALQKIRSPEPLALDEGVHHVLRVPRSAGIQLEGVVVAERRRLAHRCVRNVLGARSSAVRSSIMQQRWCPPACPHCTGDCTR